MRVLEDNSGTASLDTIYSQIIKYYPNAQKSKTWQEGIRGVLYREIRNNKTIQIIDKGVYFLLKR